MRIDHVANVCRDADATARFYGELLGLPLTRFAHDGAEMLQFALPGGGSLVFTARPDAPRAPTPDRDWQQRHIGLTVADLTPWLARLRAHAIRHQLVDDDRLYFADPDGHVLELEVAAP
jgi:glyoxylase I family protein